MKSFDIVIGDHGTRMIVYPAGTLERRRLGCYTDAPYLWVRRFNDNIDSYELVLRGHVHVSGHIQTNNPANPPMGQVLDLMQQL
jgi:hypothetical protein